MLCPNCKTELIEVNGRYICSDCGREIPENEVTTGDWSNTTPMATGLYEGKDTPSVPEEGSQPIGALDTAITESNQAADIQSVEEVLQDQADAVETEPPKTIPPIDLNIPAETQAEMASEPGVASEPDSGFYAAGATPEPVPVIPPATDSTPIENAPEIPNNEVTPDVVPTPEAEPIPVSPVISNVAEGSISDIPEGSFQQGRDDNLETAEPTETVVGQVTTPEPIPVTPVQEVQTIPVNVPTPEVVPEPVTEQPEVVKDMFENVPAAPINDPGLYMTPTEELPTNNQAQQTSVNAVPVMSNEKRLNLLVLIGGVILGLGLIGGGTWAYIALSSKAKVVVAPVVNTSTAWQELQVVDAGFKISFPGQPEKTESTETINGLDTPVITESYTTDDMVYTAAYATVDATVDALPTFVTDLANLQSLDVVSKTVGKYYDADAIDFTLGRDSATYQGKIMLKDNTYILVMAGSSSGQTVDYDKFIKSFNFITATAPDSSDGDTTN